MTILECAVCHRQMRRGIASWHFVCPGCGHESSTLTPAINDDNQAPIDEAARAVALEGLRKRNYGTLLKTIEGYMPSGRLLDVGAAHGWFVELASARYRAMGIEPDRDVSDGARSRGLPIRLGYFPGALEDGEKFDIVVFNDVIEHIADIGATVLECHERLDPGGLLVITLPSNRGIIYRLARWCARLGYAGPFERMWQKGLPSPHVHYFNPRTLLRLLEQHGFSQVQSGTLPSLSLRGLKERLNYAGSPSAAVVAVEFIAMAMLYPWLKLLPGDIVYGIYRRS